MHPAQRLVADAAQQEVQPDMTAMIDCVFLLIIFFVCIDFRVLEAKLEARAAPSPGAGSSALAPVEQLLVRVVSTRAGDRVYPLGGPGQLDPVTQRPYRFVLAGHAVQWLVGPRLVTSVDALAAALQQAFANAERRRAGAGGPAALPVVIELQAGTVNDDAARTADAVRAAGFTDIRFRSAAGGR